MIPIIVSSQYGSNRQAFHFISNLYLPGADLTADDSGLDIPSANFVLAQVTDTTSALHPDYISLVEYHYHRDYHYFTLYFSFPDLTQSDLVRSLQSPPQSL